MHFFPTALGSTGRPEAVTGLEAWKLLARARVCEFAPSGSYKQQQVPLYAAEGCLVGRAFPQDCTSQGQVRHHRDQRWKQG